MSEPNTTALVTGASAGLGREFAHLFAADGHDVVLVARRKGKLETLASELSGAYGITATPLPGDLADGETPQRIFDTISDQGLRIEFLVNNAGFGSNGPFVELELERELDMIQVNVSALVALTRLFLPAMVERGSGRVLNIGSTAGFQAGPYMATYYASKAFVNLFTEALAFELEGTGVTATVHCPGATDTEFADVAGNDESKLFAAGAASANEVARHAYDAMMKGKPMAVHGFKNKLGVQSLRVSPRSLVRRIAASLNQEA